MTVSPNRTAARNLFPPFQGLGTSAAWVLRVERLLRVTA
jgi:hypothetical protein